MRNIRNNIVTFWRQLSPSMRWFVLAAYGIAYVAVALSFDPLTVLLGVVVGTVGLLGVLAGSLAVCWAPVWIVLMALGHYRLPDPSPLSRLPGWLSFALLWAVAYGCLQLLPLEQIAGAMGLYGIIAVGWIVILGALYRYAPNTSQDVMMVPCEACGADIYVVEIGRGQTLTVDPSGTPHSATCTHEQGAPN